MTEEFIIEITMLAMQTTGLLCAPPTIAIVVVGLISNVLQTVTQMKDPALAFVPKVVAVGIVLVLFLPWSLRIIHQFTTTIFNLMSAGTL